MLKTLHFTNAWHASSGGIATFYRALMDYADRVGWQARLVVPSDQSRFEAVGKSCGIYHLKAKPAPLSPEYRVLYPHQFLPRNSPIRGILRQEQPDLIEVCDKYTLLYLAGLARIGKLSELEKRPAVVGLSCERMDENVAAYTPLRSLSRVLARSYMKCLYFPQFDHHIAVSRHAAGELETASRGHKVSRGVWIRGMGVDVNRFSPLRRDAGFRAKLLEASGASKEATLLLYAGRLAPEKNLDLLLDTLDMLRPSGEYRLLIAGSGSASAGFFEAARRRHPGLVVPLGYQADRDRLADLYANVDAFLHPNPREPFGIAPLEAMAAGTALVAPDSGGVTTYADPSNAWVTAPTAADFAWAVREIVSNPAERHRRTQRGRIAAEQRSWPVACEAFHRLYLEIRERVTGERPEHVPGDALEQRPLEPAFYSTLGNWLGFEIRPDAARGNGSAGLIPGAIGKPRSPFDSHLDLEFKNAVFRCGKHFYQEMFHQMLTATTRSANSNRRKCYS